MPTEVRGVSKWHPACAIIAYSNYVWPVMRVLPLLLHTPFMASAWTSSVIKSSRGVAAQFSDGACQENFFQGKKMLQCGHRHA